MANDHYIPKLLTRPWEFGERRLRYFDFCTRRFQDAPVRRLFAKRGLNSPTLEIWFDRKIETPVGAFIAELRKGRAAKAPNDWFTRRALALLFILSPQRIEEGRWSEREEISLEVVATWNEAKLDQAAMWVHERFKLHVVAVPGELFFTEAVTFVYPMPQRPVIAMPLGLGHALLAYDGPIPASDLARNIARAQLSALSVGVGTNVQRVIVPPGWREASFRDPETTCSELLELRENVVAMVNLVAKYSRVAGLNGWHVT